MVEVTFCSFNRTLIEKLVWKIINDVRQIFLSPVAFKYVLRNFVVRPSENKKTLARRYESCSLAKIKHSYTKIGRVWAALTMFLVNF